MLPAAATPLRVSVRCLISQDTNQDFKRHFKVNCSLLQAAQITKHFPPPESHRENEAWVDPRSGDLLLLTDVKEDPVLDSQQEEAREREQNKTKTCRN